MTKMTNEINALAKVLNEKHSAKMKFRAEFRALQNIEWARATAQFELEESLLANQLRKAGGTHRLIQDQIGVSNWDSYKTFMAVGASTVSEVADAKAALVENSVFKIVREIPVGDGTYHYEVSVEGQTHTSYVRMGGTGNVWVEDVDDESLSRPLRDWYREISGKGNPEK